MRYSILAAMCLCSSLNVESALANSNSPSCFVDNVHEFDLKSEKIIPVLSANSEGYKIAEDYVGLAQSYFYEFSVLNKTQTVEVYNADIAAQILLVNENIRSVSPHAQESANLVSATLIQLTTALNQLFLDSSINAADSIIQSDYAQLSEVIDAFENQFPNTLKHKNKKSVRQAIRLANVSLHAFVDNEKIYVQQLNQLVYSLLPVNQELIASQKKLVLNLRKFVVATVIAAYLSTNKG